MPKRQGWPKTLDPDTKCSRGHGFLDMCRQVGSFNKRGDSSGWSKEHDGYIGPLHRQDGEWRRHGGTSNHERHSGGDRHTSNAVAGGSSRRGERHSPQSEHSRQATANAAAQVGNSLHGSSSNHGSNSSNGRQANMNAAAQAGGSLHGSSSARSSRSRNSGQAFRDEIDRGRPRRPQSPPSPPGFRRNDRFD